MFLIEKFLVINKKIITMEDVQILFQMYQPLIGSDTVSLYLTLNSLVEKSITSTNYIYEDLTMLMDIKPKNLEASFSKLEGVGLIRKYKKDDHNIYELNKPCKKETFLKNELLNKLLNEKLNKKLIKMLNEKYSFNLDGYKDVTKVFDEVYDIKDSIESTAPIEFKDMIDLDFILSSIPKGLVNKDLIDEDMKELIINLAYLYKIDKVDMSNLIRTSVGIDGLIDSELLKEKARNFHKFANPNRGIGISYKKTNELAKTNKEKAILTFKSFSPFEYLTNRTKTNLTKGEKETLETLLIDYQMEPEVINTLISYVLKVNKFKFTKSYVLTIANQWNRAGLKTAEDALEFAEKDYVKKDVKKVYTKKFISKEVGPSWYDDELSKEELSNNESSELKELLKR